MAAGAQPLPHQRRPPFALPPEPHAKAPERVLEDLALWTQVTAPAKGLVAEPALRRRLEKIFAETPDCEARCDDFMDQMPGHAGLLMDRGGRRFGFIHLTFMEYLAGRPLARQYLDPKRGTYAVVAAPADHLNAPDWRETSLLCLAALSKSHGSPEGAAAVIEGLLDREPAAAGQAALLCGGAVPIFVRTLKPLDSEPLKLGHPSPPCRRRSARKAQRADASAAMTYSMQPVALHPGILGGSG